MGAVRRTATTSADPEGRVTGAGPGAAAGSKPTRGAGRSGLRWSVFTVADNLDGIHRREHRYDEILDYVASAERLGYWAFFFAEHHFDPHGEVPDPWLLVAAASERTRGSALRLGPMVSNLAFRHPVRLAEQALLANQLSADRVEIGIGSGNVLQEHVAFGLHPDPLAKKREAFDGGVPTFLAALEGRPVAAPGHPAGSVRIPVTAIRPVADRLWIAAGRAEVAVRFASQGHSVAFGPPFATMKELSALSDQVRQLRAGLNGQAAPRIAAAFPTYVGPDPPKAVAALDRFMVQKHRDGSAHLAPESRSAPAGATADELVRRNLALIGTPEEVAGQLKAVVATGITDLFAIPDFGGTPPDDVIGTLRNLAELDGLRAK